MKNKAFCIMMVLMLIITPCYRAYADVGSITIAGGTIGVGGVAGGALAGLAGPAVVAVFVGMMAVGMDVELTKQSQQEGMTKTQFVKSKIEQYCQEAGKTADVFYKGITNGTRVLKDGSLAFTDATALQIKQFINWLFDTNQITQPSQESEGTVALGGFNAPLVSVGESLAMWTDNYYSGGTITYLSKENTNIDQFAVIAVTQSETTLQQRKFWYYLISNAGGSIRCNYRNSDHTCTLDKVSGTSYYAFGVGNFLSVRNEEVPVYIGYTSSIKSLLQSWDQSWNPNMSGTATNDGFTGTRDEWNDRSSVFDPSQGWPTVVNPGVVGQIPIPADTDITVNVREYLEKLQEVLDQLKDRVIEGVDKADGIPKDWDIPDTVEANPTIGKQPPTPDSDTTPVSNNDPPSPSTEPNIASAPLKFNLTEIFPFCIPFDIKDMIGLLAADPVAPAYTVNWNIPIVNVPLNFTVDLSPWNSVATICRKMQMLLFIIGLAMVTRNLIRG